LLSNLFQILNCNFTRRTYRDEIVLLLLDLDHQGLEDVVDVGPVESGSLKQDDAKLIRLLFGFVEWNDALSESKTFYSI
jgi:hypothetical protein